MEFLWKYKQKYCFHMILKFSVALISQLDKCFLARIQGI